MYLNRWQNINLHINFFRSFVRYIVRKHSIPPNVWLRLCVSERWIWPLSSPPLWGSRLHVERISFSFFLLLLSMIAFVSYNGIGQSVIASDLIDFSLSTVPLNKCLFFFFWFGSCVRLLWTGFLEYLWTDGLRLSWADAYKIIPSRKTEPNRKSKSYATIAFAIFSILFTFWCSQLNDWVKIWQRRRKSNRQSVVSTTFPWNKSCLMGHSFVYVYRESIISSHCSMWSLPMPPPPPTSSNIIGNIQLEYNANPINRRKK